MFVKNLDGHSQSLAWISPRHTGPIGLPSTKHDTMSVPPEIEDRHTSLFTFW